MVGIHGDSELLGTAVVSMKIKLQRERERERERVGADALAQVQKGARDKYSSPPSQPSIPPHS